MAGRKRPQRRFDIWPGFVDALSGLLIVFVIVSMIFMTAQFFLGEELVGRDRTIDRLMAQISTLSKELEEGQTRIEGGRRPANGRGRKDDRRPDRGTAIGTERARPAGRREGRTGNQPERPARPAHRAGGGSRGPARRDRTAAHRPAGPAGQARYAGKGQEEPAAAHRQPGGGGQPSRPAARGGAEIRQGRRRPGRRARQGSRIPDRREAEPGGHGWPNWKPKTAASPPGWPTRSWRAGRAKPQRRRTRQKPPCSKNS